mgnify:CR=1 FL=1
MREASSCCCCARRRRLCCRCCCRRGEEGLLGDAVQEAAHVVHLGERLRAGGRVVVSESFSSASARGEARIEERDGETHLGETLRIDDTVDAHARRRAEGGEAREGEERLGGARFEAGWVEEGERGGRGGGRGGRGGRRGRGEESL